MLHFGVRRCAPVTIEPERVGLSTEVSSLETEVDLQPSDCRQPETAGDDRLTIGQKLSGRYRIERVLGEGGMGVVYLATDEQVGETFAIKVLKEGLGPEALSLLREEVRRTQKLSHPNIVDMHSVNVDGAKLYVVMEYLEGKPLNALLDEDFGRGMPFDRAWPIIEDVGVALGYAHDHNVIHSDLKPANVLVTTAGKSKLLDFGIARVSRGPLRHMRSGPLALTPAYASCEMLRGAEADARDDIYSFACVIYEMLSGKRPFGELAALEARETGAKPAPLGVLLRGQNAALAKALAFDREGRTASVEGFLAGLAADQKPRARSVAVAGGAVMATLAAVALTYLALDRLWVARHSVVVHSVAPDAPPAASRASGTGATFNPPPHSIAVLPFVNMSGDKDQEYFSDGLSEELLNDLARINELQVAARTSAFSFKGKDTDIETIARKLNVGAVLEGSVRRSGRMIRVTAQLNNGVNGFHLWSQTYDRNLGDVLKLQTQIATAVASALKVTLLSDQAAKIEVGGTRNAAAYDAYLRASKTYWMWSGDEKDLHRVIALYTEAIRLDPDYALAYAARSLVVVKSTDFPSTMTAAHARIEEAGSDARKAIALTPNLGEGHLALAVVYERALNLTAAMEEYERALALEPGNARILRDYGGFAGQIGRGNLAIQLLRRALALDPLSRDAYVHLGYGLVGLRRYAEAIAAFREAEALDPPRPDTLADAIGIAYYLLGDFESARAACEKIPDTYQGPVCLAMAYARLGRRADAEAALARDREGYGDQGWVGYSQIYAQWGDKTRALDCLETALRLRDGSLLELRHPLFDPLRKEPRLQAIERALKFPD